MCALLLSADCSLLHAQDATGAAPLSTAIMHGHIQMARLLLSAGAHPDHADQKGRNAFHASCRYGDVNFLAMLLENTPSLVDSLDSQRRNGLCYLFGNRDHARQSQVLALLLRRACDANNVDNLGLTPLFYATESGNAAAAGLLFKYADQPSIPNPRALPRQASMPSVDFEKGSRVALGRAAALRETDEVWAQGEPVGVSPLSSSAGSACRDVMQERLEQRRLQGIEEMNARRQAAMLRKHSEADEKLRQQREARTDHKGSIENIRAWARDLTEHEFRRLSEEDLLLARLVAELRNAKTSGPAGLDSSPAVSDVPNLSTAGSAAPKASAAKSAALKPSDSAKQASAADKVATSPKAAESHVPKSAAARSEAKAPPSSGCEVAASKPAASKSAACEPAASKPAKAESCLPQPPAKEAAAPGSPAAKSKDSVPAGPRVESNTKKAAASPTSAAAESRQHVALDFESDGWKLCEQLLSRVPVFIIVDRDRDPFQFTQEGEKVFFAFFDPMQAHAQLSSMCQSVPVLKGELDIMPMGLGTAYHAQAAGACLLIPNEADLREAGVPPDAQVVPMFFFPELQDEEGFTPVFPSLADAKGVMVEVGDMELTPISLDDAVEMLCRRDGPQLQFVPPRTSIQYLQSMEES